MLLNWNNPLTEIYPSSGCASNLEYGFDFTNEYLWRHSSTNTGMLVTDETYTCGGISDNSFVPLRHNNFCHSTSFTLFWFYGCSGGIDTKTDHNTVGLKTWKTERQSLFNALICHFKVSFSITSFVVYQFFKNSSTKHLSWWWPKVEQVKNDYKLKSK